MNFFLKKYLTPQTMAMAADYVQMEVHKSRLEARQPQVYEEILELQEADLGGKCDPEKLKVAQVELMDVKQKIEASGRAMTRIMKALPAAFASDIESQYRQLDKLRDELQTRQAKAARRIGLADQVASFFRGTDSAATGSISGVLAQLQQEILLIEDDPEALDFEDLRNLVKFLENTWHEPETSRPTLGEGFQITRRKQEREGHMIGFVRETIAAARREEGVESPPKLILPPGAGWLPSPSNFIK